MLIEDPSMFSSKHLYQHRRSIYVDINAYMLHLYQLKLFINILLKITDQSLHEYAKYMDI